MSSKKRLVLHSYQYDPLDRHVKSGASGAEDTQLFYCQARVATEIKGDTAYRVFETEDVVLGQQTHKAGAVDTTLVAHDDKRSTLATLKGEQHTAIAYTAAGYSASDEQRVLGFNGERNDKNTGHYLLGNGYRAFNPVLMRFNSPDSWSPFGDGGINAYAYCDNNWPNMTDVSGHAPSFIKGIANRFGRRASKTYSFGENQDVYIRTTRKSVYEYSSIGVNKNGQVAYELISKKSRKNVDFDSLINRLTNTQELYNSTRAYQHIINKEAKAKVAKAAIKEAMRSNRRAAKEQAKNAILDRKMRSDPAVKKLDDEISSANSHLADANQKYTASERKYNQNSVYPGRIESAKADIKILQKQRDAIRREYVDNIR